MVSVGRWVVFFFRGRSRHRILDCAGISGVSSSILAADRLYLLDDFARGTSRGALECHVLEQMRDAMLVRLFVAATDAGPDPERRGLQMRHAIGNHGEAGGKLGNIDAHPATPCFAARLTDSTNRSTST